MARTDQKIKAGKNLTLPRDLCALGLQSIGKILRDVERATLTNQNRDA